MYRVLPQHWIAEFLSVSRKQLAIQENLPWIKLQKQNEINGWYFRAANDTTSGERGLQKSLDDINNQTQSPFFVGILGKNVPRSRRDSATMECKSRFWRLPPLRLEVVNDAKATTARHCPDLFDLSRFTLCPIAHDAVENPYRKKRERKMITVFSFDEILCSCVL